MTRLLFVSGRVFVRWTMAMVVLGLLTLLGNVRGDEIRRPVHSAAASVHRGPEYGTQTPTMAASPAQRIPANWGPEAPGMRQAGFTDPVTVGAEPVLRSYECVPSQSDVLSATLNEQYSRQGNVRIVVDRSTNQLLVMAPEAVQQQIAEQVRAATISATRFHSLPNSLPTQSPLPLQQTQVSSPFPTAPALTRREYQLKNVTAARVESVLEVALGGRWSTMSTPFDGPKAFRLAVAGQVGFTIWFDHGQNRLLLEGPGGEAYDSCVRLIESLDVPKMTSDQVRCLMALTSLSTEDLAETANALHTTSEPAPPRGAMGPKDILLAQAEAAAPQAAPGGATDDEQVTATVQLPPTGEGEGAGLIGQVQIEMLPGLDVIVIKGNKRDVQQVVKLIQEIEEMSKETEPTVIVYHLRHVNCEALATLATTLYSEVFSARQGTVSITALVKPNALLLIGRPESVKTVVDLVKRLDRPVPPESQFKVFRLRHAAAGTAQDTIETFFQDSEGEELAALGARVNIIADVRSNTLIVRASPRDMLEVGRMIKEIDTSEIDSVNDLRVFKLKNSLAEDLEPILQAAITGEGAGAQQADEKSIGLRFVTIDAAGQKVLSPSSGILTDVRVTAHPNTNSLLISAPPDSMPLIESLIDQLDQLPVAEAQLKVFTIMNGDAAALVEMLEALFGQTTTNQNEPPVRTGASEDDSSLVTLRFATDVRTNSIIASGSVGDLAVVEAILLRLDESDVQERKSKVYRLKNVRAQDVQTAISEYLENERDVRIDQQGLFSTFEIFQREAVVVAEPVSNSLIVSATPEYYDEIAALIEQFDERDPMVMIQVLIAEVFLNDTEEFGIELGLQDSILFDRSLLGNISTLTQQVTQSTEQGIVTINEEVISSATNEPGFLFNDLTNPLGNSGASGALANANVVGSQGLSNFAMGRINNELGFGGLVLSASSESVSMLLRALKEDRRINILSRPQIMSLNNQGANIQVGERVPTITGSATTEGGGLQNQIAYEPVGLIIGVTPRISPDGLVVMEIDAEKSEVGSEAEGIPVQVTDGVTIRSPRIKTIEASTVVSALDGQTVVLGGLITSNKSKVDRRVPWLADIPIVGQLFRYQGYTSKRTELLIVLTPRIVNSEQDAELLMQTEAARMSWCLNDVLDLHEEVAFRPRQGEWDDDETITIYPDGDPNAESLETMPLEPPSGSTGTPVPNPTNGAYHRPSAQPGVPNHVAPASYESKPEAGGRVYPPTGIYNATRPVNPKTAVYQSTGY